MLTTFAVEYTYDITRTTEMDRIRPDHRAFLRDLLERGTLLASGPWLDSATPGALLLLAADDADAARRILDDDPFQRARVITHRTVRAWNPVIGPFSAQTD
ncbi:YciI family protein [Occultella kanbiaonis]|uniref:YciI family protein n=1 Tax=Occultella kanbiaonis TaxID=2675754 RepID=UPI001F474288|nr:YciI family protein [Occultella kanbiaonis]